jgi:hypothetical protein
VPCPSHNDLLSDRLRDQQIPEEVAEQPKMVNPGQGEFASTDEHGSMSKAARDLSFQKLAQ